MATLLIFAHSESGNRKAKKLLVKESFDEVLNKVFPISPPTSSLENRTQLTFTLPDGRFTFINSQVVRIVENAESVDEDEDD